MLLTLTYDELSKLIENRTGKCVTFSYYNSSTVNIKANLKLAGFEIKPEIKIKIIAIKDILLTIEYNSNRFINMLCRIGLRRIISRQTEPLIGGYSDRQISINMGLIPKLKELLPIIKIKTIYFKQDNIAVEGEVIEQNSPQVE